MALRAPLTKALESRRHTEPRVLRDAGFCGAVGSVPGQPPRRLKVCKCVSEDRRGGQVVQGGQRFSAAVEPVFRMRAGSVDHGVGLPYEIGA